MLYSGENTIYISWRFDSALKHFFIHTLNSIQKIMKEIISYSLKILVAFALGIFAASFAEDVTRYQYAEVILFFAFGIIAFYILDGLTKKISRLWKN